MNQLIKKIINPIAFFSEIKVLITGLLVGALTVLLCYELDIMMDGYLDLHHSVTNRVGLFYHAVAFIANMAVMSLVLWVLALVFNRKTRIVDVLNVVLISQWTTLAALPFVYLTAHNEAITNFINSIDNIRNIQADWSALIPFMLYSFIILFLLIVHILSLYLGFITASNSKSSLAKALFFVFLLIVETITVVITRGLIYS